MTLNGFLQTYHADCVSTLGAALWRPRDGSIDRAGIHTVDLHFVMLLTRGWMTVRMDNREVTLTANCYVDTASCHDCTVITEASPDVDGYMLVTTEKFLSHVFKSRMPFLPECFEYVLHSPVSLFDGRTAAIVAEAFASLERSIYDCANVHNDELVATKTAVLFYEISNCLLRRVGQGACGTASSRKNRLFVRFMSLLKLNARLQHNVGFYASEMCIMPQYLNRIVGEVSGRTASDTINMAVTGEIKALLANVDMPLKDVVRRTAFNDQAVFTKFFKRQTGMTPMQYRKCGLEGQALGQRV